MIDRFDQLRTQAVQQVLAAMGGSPVHIFGETRSPRIAQLDLHSVTQEITFREDDGQDYVYKIEAEVTVSRRPAS